jgi:hypothetical protein
MRFGQTTAKAVKEIIQDPFRNDVHDGARLRGTKVGRRSLAASCELFVENPNLLSTPYEVHSSASEGHFRVFLAAIEGATAEIGMENVIDLESLSSEFQFVELRRQVA